MRKRKEIIKKIIARDGLRRIKVQRRRECETLVRQAKLDWDEEGTRQNRDKIVEITDRLGKLYRRIYRFLAAAKSLRDDMEVIYEEALDRGRLNLAINELKTEILGEAAYVAKEGKTFIWKCLFTR